ncbi:hypothetical protein, partial [Mesorhizobium sp.]|uniref:hypothetical protein n=3 Tax=Mesorhizobium sp. TaxID=1871066 RepID=UPI0025FAF4E4
TEQDDWPGPSTPTAGSAGVSSTTLCSMAPNTEMGALPRSSMLLITHLLWDDKLNEIIMFVAQLKIIEIGQFAEGHRLGQVEVTNFKPLETACILKIPIQQHRTGDVQHDG